MARHTGRIITNQKYRDIAILLVAVTRPPGALGVGGMFVSSVASVAPMRTSLILCYAYFFKSASMIEFYKMQRRVKHLERNKYAETLGWVGAAGILSSYALLSFGIIDGQSYFYHLLLGIGSLGLAVVTFRHKAYQSFIVNMTFAVLALIAVTRLLITS